MRPIVKLKKNITIKPMMISARPILRAYPLRNVSTRRLAQLESTARYGAEGRIRSPEPALAMIPSS
jgi:hypothetical protein